MRIKSLINHSAQAVAEGALVALIVVGLVAGTALAGKGGGGGKPSGGGGGSVALVMLSDRGGDGGPNWGDAVTFTVSTTATTRPFVHLSCYQGEALVYTFQAGFFDSYPWSTTYSLGSQSWTGGAANCTAVLQYVASSGKTVKLSTLSFAAGA